MATHSSVLAWRISATGEPGGLPSMGLQSQTRLKRLSGGGSDYIKGFPGRSVVEKKNLPANAGDAGLIPGPGRSPKGGTGNSLQYSCLENSMDRGAWTVGSQRV